MNRIILGLDPGSYFSGFGIIEVKDEKIRHLYSGVLGLDPKKDLAFKLHSFKEHLLKVIKEFKPKELSLEDIFLGKNVKSAFVLGHFRGVCLQVAAQEGLLIANYSAKKVKKWVAGSGNASKADLARLVSYHLGGFDEFEKEDESDALALALCHFFMDHKNKIIQEIADS